MVDFKGFPAGIDNLHREDALPPTALRAALNVDLDASGKPSRRRGRQRVISGLCHSLTEALGRLVAVVDGNLTAYDANFSPTLIRAGLGPVGLQYAHTPQRTFYTDNASLRSFDADLVDAPAWPSQPGMAEGVTVVQRGGLFAGDYQIAITAVDAYGRESGAGRATLVTGIGHNGGIQLALLPNPADAVMLRIYATDANGDVLRLVGETPPGTPSYLVAVGPRGVVLEKQWLQPMPAGQCVAFHAGRLWVAVDNTLYFSEPLRYGAMNPENTIVFGAPITLLASAGSGPDSGLYVASGARTLYLSGADPKMAPLTVARANGAVRGSGKSIHTSAFGTVYENLPQTMAAVWLSSDGVFCLGLPGGSILPMTQKRMVLPVNADSAVIMERNQNGLSQLVASVVGGNMSKAGASDKMVGTIYRNGIAVD